MDIQEILHDIVKLLPHRQEALDEIHAKIDEHAAPEQTEPREASPPATGQEGGAPPA